jgi:hypothetical protein
MRWFLPLLLACGGKAQDTAVAGTWTWTGGDFDFYTQSVADGCLGGAIEVLFMPEGPAEPHAFEYPIYLPDTDELPYSSTVDLRDPFVEIPVSIEDAGGGDLRIRGSVMEAVVLGEASYGDCVVTMTVNADLHPASQDEVEGSASIAISDARGDEGRCPVFSSDSCTVALTITATRR